MSISVGSMSAGLGLDLTEFQNGMTRATELARSNTTLMSAEMKRTSREGAESLRLIDESLGIHVSRPLTRILTQEFPSLAAGLQSVLGGAVFGALATIGVEAIDKVIRSIEKAQKSQEAFAQSTRKAGETFSDAMDSYEKAATLRSLSGIDKKIFEIDAASIEEGRKKIDELTASLETMAKDAIEAHKWTTELLAGIGSASHIVFNTPASLGVEQIGKQFTEIQHTFDELSKFDALKKTSLSAEFIAVQIEEAKKSLAAMTPATSLQEANRYMQQIGLGKDLKNASLGSSQAEIDRQKEFIEYLKQISELEKANAADQSGKENEALKADYAEKQLKAQQAIAALYKEMGSSITKLQPETDPIKKLGAEIDSFMDKAEADFEAIRQSSASMLAVKAAVASLDEYESKLLKIKVALEADILSKQALEFLKGPLPGGQPTGSTVPGLVTAPTPTAPTLGAGGTTGAQLDAFGKDQAAQLKAAAAAYADLVTPAQKYQLTQQELNLLLQKGLIDQTAYTAALQKAEEEMAQATNKLEKLLAKTNDASAGMQAFFLKLNQDAGQNGKFAFDILNKGLDGFENNTVSMLMSGKANWQSYFNELTAMALKFLLNKELSSVLQGLGGMLGLGGSGGGGGGGGDASMNSAFFAALPGFASGTDYTPGGAAWVGEQGPEIVNLPAGSSVTPNSAARGGETHYHNYDMRGAVVTDDLMRKADAVRMSNITKRQAVGEAMANFSEVQKRTLQQR